MQASISDRPSRYFRVVHVWHNLLIPHELASSHYLVVRPYQQYVDEGFVVERRLTANSHRINLHLHRSSHSHAEQAKPTMGVHNSHGWLRLGKQGFFIPPWVGPNQHSHSARPLTSPSFLSVAWTMTDYDGTTQ